MPTACPDSPTCKIVVVFHLGQHFNHGCFVELTHRGCVRPLYGCPREVEGGVPAGACEHAAAGPQQHELGSLCGAQQGDDLGARGEAPRPRPLGGRSGAWARGQPQPCLCGCRDLSDPRALRCAAGFGGFSALHHRPVMDRRFIYAYMVYSQFVSNAPCPRPTWRLSRSHARGKHHGMSTGDPSDPHPP